MRIEIEKCANGYWVREQPPPIVSWTGQRARIFFVQTEPREWVWTYSTNIPETFWEERCQAEACWYGPAQLRPPQSQSFDEWLETTTELLAECERRHD